MPTCFFSKTLFVGSLGNSFLGLTQFIHLVMKTYRSKSFLLHLQSHGISKSASRPSAFLRQFIAGLSVILLSLLGTKGVSQTLYYCDIDSDIHTYDIQTCVDQLILDVQLPGGTLGDITFAPNGKLYGVGFLGELYEINLVTGAAFLVTQWYFMPPLSPTNSLICNADGMIYAAGSELYFYNTVTGESGMVGYFPTGFSSAGDLTFINGELYLSSFGNMIVKVDIDDPLASVVEFTYPVSEAIFGISTFFIDCDNLVTIGSGETGTLYYIDILNQDMTLIPCPITPTLIFGLATPQEYYASDFNEMTTLAPILLCDGDVFVYNGQSYTSDALVCTDYTGFYGCDSTVCVQLDFGASITLEIDTVLCGGGSIVFDGQSYSSSGSYNIFIDNINTCDTSITLNLSVQPALSVDIMQNGANCSAGVVEIVAQASNASIYKWSTGETSSAISISTTGTYGVTVTNAAGCSDTDEINVVLSDPPTATASSAAPVCAGEASGGITISAAQGGTEPYSYSLNNGPNGSNPVFENLPSGTYNVLVIDANGCTWDSTLVLASPPAFTVDAGPDLSINQGSSVELAANANQVISTISWQPSDFLSCPTCPQTTATPLQNIEYQVFATNIDGCTASDAIFIQVKNTADVYAPNVFSPNGDGFNDSFTLFGGIGVKEIESLLIFDRWGGLVFESEKGILPGDLALGWDGTWREKDASAGVYTWTALIKLLNDKTVRVSGDVTLVR